MSVTITISTEDGMLAREEMMKVLGVQPRPVSAVKPAEAAPVAPVVPEVQPPAESPAAEKRPSGRTRARRAEEAAAETRGISSGVEERVDPAVAAQDKADETAETETKKAETKKLTHDDVRTALGAYVKKFGMPAAQEDGPRVLVLAFGEGKAKVSDIPDTQEALGKAVAGINEMLEKNPFNRTAVEAV